jgi:carbamoyl-phosphate synthase small subunit
MDAHLVLEDGATLAGRPFGWKGPAAGEVVFNTGMVGYPEALTDPSYQGQIVVLTYPLIGNYGVPADTPRDGLSYPFESDRIQVAGLIVAELSPRYSHHTAARSLDDWLLAGQVPGLAGIDTRALTQKLRRSGSLLGKIVCPGADVPFRDPNKDNLVARVSVKQPAEFGSGPKRVAVIDCGCKNHIVRSLCERGVAVTVFPWDWPVNADDFDGVLISNGPGDPALCGPTIATIRELLADDKPVLGICLGHQLLALAAGARTYKLKYGHRSQNQPCLQVGTQRCYMTSQNHGYAVEEDSLPAGWAPWFRNANDSTNEGIRHHFKPFRSVQFHPEASPGPVDTAGLFDEFIDRL